MTKPISKNYLNTSIYLYFFSGSIFCLPLRRIQGLQNPWQQGNFFCHPLHLEVIIWGNIIRGFAYKQQKYTTEKLNLEILGEGMFAENFVHSIQPSKRCQNGLLSFIWNRVEETHHDCIFKRSKSRNAQMRKENKRKPD